MIGEIIHHLRSCLDHIVAEYVIRSGFELTRDHQFPITRCQQDFEKERSRRLSGLPPSAIEEIEKMQPYNQGAGRPIKAIHDLDIDDKHKNIIVTTEAYRIGKNIYIGSNSGQAVIIGMSPPDPINVTTSATTVFYIDLEQENRSFTAKADIERIISISHPNLASHEPIEKSIQLMISAIEATIKRMPPPPAASRVQHN